MASPQHTAAVAYALDALTNDELARLNMQLTADWSVRDLPFYAKIAHLFTEQGGTAMHIATREALDRVVLKRLA